MKVLTRKKKKIKSMEEETNIISTLIQDQAFRVLGQSMNNGTSESFLDGDVVYAQKIDQSEFNDKLLIYPFWVILYKKRKAPILKKIIAMDDNCIVVQSLNESKIYKFNITFNDIQALYYVTGVSRSIGNALK